METKQHKEETKIRGFLTASVFDMTNPKAIKLEYEIQQHISKPKREPNDRKTYIEMITELKRLFQKREYKTTNLITTVGRSTIAQRLANDTTYTGIINYGSLGTSSTTPVDGNTQLGTEVFRKVTASVSNTTNIAFIDFFYSKTDTNGTYNEFGTFIDGTATANSGQMFTHALTGGWVKTASESMTVALQYTIS